MATGIQTGIRTGSSPLAPGKGPAGGGSGLGKVMASWNAMSAKVKFACIAGVVVVIGGVLGGLAMVAANKPVALYATALSPSDVQEIGRRLNETGMHYSIETGKIMVQPDERSRVIGLLLSYGLPHRPLSTGKEEGGMTPKTEFEKRLAATQTLENDLIDQLRQFDVVADAYVKLVPADEDALPSEKKPAKASIQLFLKSGKKPTKVQIEAIMGLVAYSVPGLSADNVNVSDTAGFVYTANGKIITPGGDQQTADGGGAFENENIAIKKAYEKLYTTKVQDALSKILGAENYTVSVNADIDFSQTKIESTTVGGPTGDNKVVTIEKRDQEGYKKDAAPPAKDGKPAKAGSDQVGMPLPGGGDKDTSTDYRKGKIEVKYDVGKTTKTVLVAPGVVSKLTATVAVNGKRAQAELDSIGTIVRGALGTDSTRNDNVSVVNVPFVRPAVPGADNGFPGFNVATNDHPKNTPMNQQLLLFLMVVPTAVLLGVMAIFLLKQRRVQAEKTGLILSTSSGTTTSDISDLLSDKIGRSTAVSQTTKVNNTEQLEKLAKEKPTKVAELLKSTWLSDKER